MKAIAVVGLLVCCADRIVSAAPDWNPATTWVFAVGILEWQHPEHWPAMPHAQRHRRDEEFVRHFHDAGVPPSQIVYLKDREATLDRIQHSLQHLLTRTRPGDLLVLYYTGHGFRDHHSHLVHFANYDSKDGVSAWSVRALVDAVEQRFHGNRAILIADSCFSGGLMDEVLRRRPRVSYVCLCSSFSHNSSTGAWTYTDIVLKALRGNPVLDTNSDGAIELAELAHYAEMEMAFVDRQKAVFHAADEFPKTWKIAATLGAHHPRVGDRIEAEWHGQWYRAQITNVVQERVKVHYVHFADTWDEWLEAKRIRAFDPHQWPAGTKVEIRDRHAEKWDRGVIRRSWYGIYFVHYDDYGTEWDDWVTPERVRQR